MLSDSGATPLASTICFGQARHPEIVLRMAGLVLSFAVWAVPLEELC